MMRRVTFIWILFFLIGLQLYAQRISNVRFEPFGRAIRIHYTLSRLPFDSFAALNLFVSTNGGESFIGPLVQVQGEIGKVAGNGEKSVVWQVMDEIGRLEGIARRGGKGEAESGKYIDV